MKIPSIARAAAATAVLCALFSPQIRAAEPQAPRETVTPAFAYPIANAPGKQLTALIVSYAPGGKTPAHRHGRAFVVGYVLEGSIRSKLGNGEERVYRAGESWTEQPGAHHTVSENASATEPAKLLALLVAGKGAKDLVTIDKK